MLQIDHLAQAKEMSNVVVTVPSDSLQMSDGKALRYIVIEKHKIIIKTCSTFCRLQCILQAIENEATENFPHRAHDIMVLACQMNSMLQNKPCPRQTRPSMDHTMTCINYKRYIISIQILYQL